MSFWDFGNQQLGAYRVIDTMQKWTRRMRKRANFARTVHVFYLSREGLELFFPHNLTLLFWCFGKSQNLIWLIIMRNHTTQYIGDHHNHYLGDFPIGLWRCSIYTLIIFREKVGGWSPGGKMVVNHRTFGVQLWICSWQKASFQWWMFSPLKPSQSCGNWPYL